VLLVALLSWLFVNLPHGTARVPASWPWILEIGKPACAVRRAYTSEGVSVREVTLRTTLRWRGRPVDIFAYVCIPADRKGKLPGLMVVHGGGSTAGLPDAMRWARRGYEVVSLDLPGKGQGRAGSRSTGPDMIVDNLLETFPAEDNYLVYAVASVREAISFLAAEPRVDSARLGIIGVSWGGVITLLVNGQDSRLKAAINVFGAGFIPEDCTWDKQFHAMSEAERAIWDTRIDPRNFLASQHAPILFISGTNDHCYYLPIFQKSFFKVSAPKRLALIANQRHDFTGAGQRLAAVWLEEVLDGKLGFPLVSASAPREKGADLRVTAWAKGPARMRSATLFYSPGGPQKWTTRHWDAVDGRRVGDHFEFTLRRSKVRPEVVYYVNVEDAKGALASTPVRSLFQMRLRNRVAFAVSSPIVRTFRREPPFIVLGHDQAVRHRASSGAALGARPGRVYR
jgi:dienelactone hydrolase